MEGYVDYLNTEYARNKDIECYQIEQRKREEVNGNNKGDCDQNNNNERPVHQTTVDIDKSYIPENVNILKWQDQEVVLQGGDNDRG